MNSIFAIPHTIVVYLYIIVVFVLHRFTAFLVTPFYKDREWGLMRYAAFYLNGALAVMGARVTFEGVENIPKEGSFIIISNHQSYLDIPLFMVTVPRKFSFFAKTELLSVPLLGWDIRHMGHWVVDRDDHKKAMRQMDEVAVAVEAGRPLLVFPEGTRSKDGTVGSFKRGSFMIAAQTGAAVVPCRIEGAHKVLGKTSRLVHPGKVKVTFYPPIPVEKKDTKPEQKASAIQLLERCYELINP